MVADGASDGNYRPALDANMITVTMLGSGSKGNAILVDGSEGSVLVDAGFGVRTLAKRFEAAGRRTDDVHGLLLTHEHVDHACGAAAACERFNWPVYATAPTLAALRVQPSGAPTQTVALASSGPTRVGGFAVDHAPVPHDAADCRALVLTDVRSGSRVGIVLDAGDVPPALPEFLDRLDLLVLEANHDEGMLEAGPYPWPLKERIRGGTGHLSNTSAASLAGRCAHKGLRGVILAHLSETNNRPALAIETVREQLRRHSWRREALVAATQRAPLAPTHSRAERRVPAPAQLDLWC